MARRCLHPPRVGTSRTDECVYLTPSSIPIYRQVLEAVAELWKKDAHQFYSIDVFQERLRKRLGRNLSYDELAFWGKSFGGMYDRRSNQWSWSKTNTGPLSYIDMEYTYSFLHGRANFVATWTPAGVATFSEANGCIFVNVPVDLDLDSGRVVGMLTNRVCFPASFSFLPSTLSVLGHTITLQFAPRPEDSGPAALAMSPAVSDPAPSGGVTGVATPHASVPLAASSLVKGPASVPSKFPSSAYSKAPPVVPSVAAPDEGRDVDSLPHAFRGARMGRRAFLAGAKNNEWLFGEVSNCPTYGSC